MKNRKLWLFVILVPVLLFGCAPKAQVYQVVWLDVFDTVTTLRGYDASEEAFQEKAAAVHRELLEYHRLFDIYHPCADGIQAVNANAGVGPAAVDSRVLALLSDCREYYELTGGRVNAAMGSVLSLWHDARENAALPDMGQLQEAAKHTTFDSILIDMDAGTVFITDPLQSLDVGAIAKGWAAQQVSRLLPEGYLLNLGGNICAVGEKADGSSWNIGIQSPADPAKNACVVGLRDISAVTSGDYQRYFTVDGKNYHHIIDPDTLLPAGYFRSVTVLCPDSALADCLSTALFLMTQEEGAALAEKCNAEAMWIDGAGNMQMTEGFARMMQ